MEDGAWFWPMRVARYIAHPLILRYHCLDPTNHDISRVHCSSIWQVLDRAFVKFHWHQLDSVPILPYIKLKILIGYTFIGSILNFFPQLLLGIGAIFCQQMSPAHIAVSNWFGQICPNFWTANVQQLLEKFKKGHNWTNKCTSNQNFEIGIGWPNTKKIFNKCHLDMH